MVTLLLGHIGMKNAQRCHLHVSRLVLSVKSLLRFMCHFDLNSLAYVAPSISFL